MALLSRSSVKTDRERAGCILGGLFVFIIACTIYSNSLGGEFIFDDEYFVLHNRYIRDLANIPHFFANPAAVAYSRLANDVYRPVTTLSFALDYALWGLDQFGYHLTNVVVHGLNAALLLLFLYALFGDLFIACAAAFLFACHPVQTEVVSWISGRSSVLFLFFYLLSFLFYIRSVREKKMSSYLVSIIFCLIALFAKEMAISLPLMLIIYDIHFPDGVTCRRKIVRYLPYILLTVLYLLVRSQMLGRVSQCGWWGGSPWHTFLTMVTVLVDYIQVTVLPVTLCAFYEIAVVKSPLDPRFVLASSLVALLVASLPLLFRRSRRASFCVWWFLITLLPVSNIVPLKALMAERFLYLPLIGFATLLAYVLARIDLSRFIRADRRAVAVFLVFIIATTYGVRTMLRNEDWKEPVTMCAKILKIEPRHRWALTALGNSYMAREDYAAALVPLHKAVALTKEYAPPRNALGFCYLSMQRYEEAIRWYREGLALDPEAFESVNSLGVTYANLKRYDEAVAQFRRALELNPEYISPRLNLATTYERLGDIDKALAEYRQIARIARDRTDRAIVYLRIGDLYYKQKEKLGGAGWKERSLDNYAQALRLCGREMGDLKKMIEARLMNVERAEKQRK